MVPIMPAAMTRRRCLESMSSPGRPNVVRPATFLLFGRKVLHVVDEERPHLGLHVQRDLRHLGRIAMRFPERYEAEGFLGLLCVSRVAVHTCDRGAKRCYCGL